MKIMNWLYKMHMCLRNLENTDPVEGAQEKSIFDPCDLGGGEDSIADYCELTLEVASNYFPRSAADGM